MTRHEEGAELARLFLETLTHRGGADITPADLVASAMVSVLNTYDLSHQHHVELDVADVYAATLKAARRRGKYPSELGLRRCMIAIHRVAISRGVVVGDLQSPCHDAPLVRIRDEASWVCRQDGHPFALIGIALGGRDHSTVIAAVRRHKRELARKVTGAARDYAEMRRGE
jgi:chromosomal replication initiation ATPase DnaA